MTEKKETVSASEKTGMSRRKFIYLVGAAGATAVAAYAASSYLYPPQPPEEVPKELTMLFAGGSWQKYFHEVYGEGFERENSIKIVYDTTAMGERIAKLNAYKEKQIFDLVHLSPAMAVQSRELGLLDDISEDRVPNVKDVNPAFKIEKYFVPKVVTIWGIAYNTKVLKEPPKSWWSLWDSAYKGKIFIPAFGWTGEAWLHLINKLLGGNEENLDPGIKKIAQLVKDNKALVADSADQALAFFRRGEVVVAGHWDGRTRELMKEGLTLDFVYPEEGVVNFSYGTGLVKGRPKSSTRLTEKLINLQLDPAKQAQFVQKVEYSPTNLKAMALLPAAAQHLKITDEQMKILNKVTLDYFKMAKVRDYALDRWNKEVLGKA